MNFFRERKRIPELKRVTEITHNPTPACRPQSEG